MQSLWMLLASALFAVMGACVKLASQHYSVAEIVMYRSAIGAAILFAFVQASGVFATLISARGRRPGLAAAAHPAASSNDK